MRTFAQILGGRVHWVFAAPERPEFAPSIVLVDVTDIQPQPGEGWLYDATTGVFSEPPATPSPPAEPDVVMEALAALYEDNLRLSAENLTMMEALAALYEQISGGVAV